MTCPNCPTERGGYPDPRYEEDAIEWPTRDAIGNTVFYLSSKGNGGNHPTAGVDSKGNPEGDKRVFETGATRDIDADKIDIEGFMSPAVIEEYCRYMHKHRFEKDGNIRASDNWQKGIPVEAYMKSLLRHVLALWHEHRGEVTEEGIMDALCGILFNCQGYMYEIIRGR